MILRRRYPNFFSGFEITEHEVSSVEDIKEVDWVQNWIYEEQNILNKLLASKRKPKGVLSIGLVRDYLGNIMFSEKWRSQYCHLMVTMPDDSYWAIGYLLGTEEELLTIELPEWHRKGIAFISTK